MVLISFSLCYSIVSSSDESANTKGEEATLDSMVGVFYILVAGVVCGMVVVLCECCVALKRDAKHRLHTEVRKTTT